MDAPIETLTFTFDLDLAGDKRVVFFTWVKVNPACRTIPEVPLDFYIIKTLDEKGNWVLL